MAKGLLSDILGFNPAEYQQQQLALLTSPIRQAQNPYERIGASLGSLLGGAFLSPDPELQRVAKIKQIQTGIAQSGEKDPTKLATMFADELSKDEELAPLSLQVRSSIKTTPSKTLSPSDTFAQAGLALGIPPKADLSQYSPEEAKKIQDEIQRQKEGVAGAGVPGAGELKVTDVAGARKLTEDIVGGDKARLTTIGLLKTNIATIRQKNPTAVPQLERGLVKLVGDSQIGQNEVRQALGASGFPQSVIEGVNRFFSGLPTDLKIDQVEASIEAIEDYYANRLNKGLGTASSILQDTKIPKSTIDKIVGQPYTSAVEKKNKAKISSLKGQDKEAYNWAKSKPDDPRSAAILNKLGVR